MNTPVALIVFNRPEQTRQVLDTIRQAKPDTLFVIADGPRPDAPTDKELCAQVRAVIDSVDWDCNVLKNYSDVNLGCGVRVSTGLHWVFDQVPEAIILEDDCLPDPSFFRYCAELLERYQHDTRIISISGTNFQFGRSQMEYSYYFSRYVHSWGWATWRRAWHHYDHDMSLWPEVRDHKLLFDILNDTQAVSYWTRIFERTYNNQIDTWDFRWLLTSWLQSGLNILPAANLVSNIGFQTDATHTKDPSQYAGMATESLNFPLQHPPYLIRNLSADDYTQDTLFKMPSLYTRARSRLKRLTPGKR